LLTVSREEWLMTIRASAAAIPVALCFSLPASYTIRGHARRREDAGNLSIFSWPRILRGSYAGRHLPSLL
jgi:hypothetical protein